MAPGEAPTSTTADTEEQQENPPTEQQQEAEEAPVSTTGPEETEEQLPTGEQQQEASVSAAEEKESADQQEEETMEQKKEKAKALFTEGKRHFLSNSFAEASKALADACQYHVAAYGDFGAECADPYLYYGKALLELARMEPGVFSGALEGVVESGEDSSTEEADTEEEVEAVGEEAAATNEQETPGEDDQFEDTSKLTEETENKEEAAAVEGGEPAEASSAEESAEAEEGVPKEQQGEEAAGGSEERIGDESVDVSNLQLAWEMFDMARVICEKQEGEEWREKLSECFLALGEVAIEDERYQKAVEDLNSCLTIQKQIYKNNDRRIAETFFQVGRAHNLSCAFEEAASAFKSSVQILEERKSWLECGLAELGEGQESKEGLSKEVKELAELIPEIQGKVVDCEESQKSADQRKQEMETEQGESTIGFEQGQGDDKTVSNISHLVRKPLKRKPDEEEEESTKRSKADLQDNGTEQEETVNGHTNGHAAPEEVEG